MTKTSRRIGLALAIIGFITFAAGKSDAGNLVVNPGFEAGDNFTGYTPSANFNAAQNFISQSIVHSEGRSAQLGQGTTDATLTQSIVTTVGDLYQVSFFLHSDGLTPNHFSATFGGTTVFDGTNIPANDPTPTGKPGFSNPTLNLVATSTSSDLVFAFHDNPSYLYLDDVSVLDITPSASPLGTTAATPEPSTLISAGIAGLMGLGYAVRRRKAKSAA